MSTEETNRDQVAAANAFGEADAFANFELKQSSKDTLTSSQKRRKKSSKKDKRKTSSSSSSKLATSAPPPIISQQAVPIIFPDDSNEIFEEDYAEAGGASFRKAKSNKKLSTPPPVSPPPPVSSPPSVAESGFVPPIHVAEPRSEAVNRKDDGYVPPTRESGGPRTSKRSRRKERASAVLTPSTTTTTSEYVPPTRVSGSGRRKSSKKDKMGDSGSSLGSSSGFVPPTHMSGPPRPTKKGGVSSARASEEYAGPSSSTNSGYVPPTHVSGPPSAGKRKKGLSVTETTEASSNPSDSPSSGYVPPTRVSGGPASGKKGAANSATVPGVTRVSGAAPSSSGGKDGKGGGNNKPGANKPTRKNSHQSSDPAAAPHRSLDIYPSLFSAGGTNVETDEADDHAGMLSRNFSVEPNSVTHTEATERIRNSNGHPMDDQSIYTTSSMSTAQIRNNRLTSEEMVARHLSSSTHSGDSGTIGQEQARARRANSRPMRMMIDGQGHTMNREELREVWARTGNCLECGIVKTHKKEKYGPFGTLRRMMPQTVEGDCYQGYCLRCHDVPELRRLLNDETIPLDLVRNEANNQSMRALQTRDQETLEQSGKQSPVAKLRTSVRFQICVLVSLLCITGAAVGIGLALSQGSKPWVPPPPTSAPSAAPSNGAPSVAPTTYEWNVVTEFRRDWVESFGSHVSLSADGQTLAVASPNFDGSRGRLDVYRDLGLGTEWAEIGDAVVGKEPEDRLGSSMSLSGDGSTVAVGSPERDEGQVHVFFVSRKLGLVPKGQVILGPTPLGQLGYSIALNHAGDRLFVSTPQYAENVNQVYGMVQAFDFDGREWVQVGSDIIGTSNGSRFGNSISATEDGTRLVVGAPLDDEKFPNAGQIFWFELRDGEWVNLIENVLVGLEENSQLGAEVRIDSTGHTVVTASSDSDEEHPNAGVVSVWGLDPTFFDAVPLGVPISGTHENAMLGYDLDIEASGEIVIASGQNTLENAGSVRVFLTHLGNYVPIGQELMGPALGEKAWFGKGPSVSIAAESERVAVGYENILRDDGSSQTAVRIYDYYSVTDLREELNNTPP